ncbi:hypothetical protein BC832DRAFT_569692 [Gaertneriomyces semiglobifer]|nr:hypothetical protein BC832DRAFT_569692 [Gaertneriomyces semiglobifer]
MTRNVDDPYCRYNIIDGKEVITYTGYLSKLDYAEDACNGLNLRGLNVTFALIALLVDLVALYMGIKLFRVRRTTYTTMLVATPGLMLVQLIIEVYSVSTFYQFGGKPEFSHLPKFLTFVCAAGILIVQGFRVDFIIIGKALPRRWKTYFVWTCVVTGVICGILFITFAAIGLSQGRDAMPVTYAVPFSLWLLFVAVLDTALSIEILRITANQAQMLTRYRDLTASNVAAFARKNKMAAIFQLLAILFFLTTFLATRLVSAGYTWGYLTLIGPPLQSLSLVWAIKVMQKARRAAMNRPSTNSLSSGSTDATKGSKVGEMQQSARTLQRLVQHAAEPVRSNTVTSSVVTQAPAAGSVAGAHRPHP